MLSAGRKPLSSAVIASSPQSPSTQSPLRANDVAVLVRVAPTPRVRASRALRARRKALALVAALHARGVDVPAMLATPTDALSLPTSMRECLDENGLTTLGAVVALNTSELPRGFSPTLLRRLSTELAKLGLAIVGCRVEEA